LKLLLKFPLRSCVSLLDVELVVLAIWIRIVFHPGGASFLLENSAYFLAVARNQGEKVKLVPSDTVAWNLECSPGIETKVRSKIPTWRNSQSTYAYASQSTHSWTSPHMHFSTHIHTHTPLGWIKTEKTLDQKSRYPRCLPSHASQVYYRVTARWWEVLRQTTNLRFIFYFDFFPMGISHMP
jgi:hypothetical protein